MTKLPRIAIDFRWLDELCLCNGQYRYAVDLIRGLAEARPAMRFVVLGSAAAPVAEIAAAFADGEHWEYRCVPRASGRRSVYREQLRYRRLLRELKIDLFHGLHSFVPMFPPVPVVETVYDMMLELFPEYEGIVRSRDYQIHKWAFSRFVSRAIAISKTTAIDLERLWRFPADRTDVVYLGPELPQAIASARRNEVPVILAPYNLEPRKNLSCLIEAAAKLKQAGTAFRLVLFGRAALNEERELEFRAKICRLQLEACIQLTGRVSDKELAELYKSAAVFVFPSLYEGFGLPVLEAMSLGARVVAHHESAMAEVVGDAGWLVDMRSMDAICGAVVAAMNSPRMGERAAQRARQFGRERMAHETLAVYEKTLAAAVCGVKDSRYIEDLYVGAGNRLPGSVAEHLGSD